MDSTNKKPSCRVEEAAGVIEKKLPLKTTDKKTTTTAKNSGGIWPPCVPRGRESKFQLDFSLNPSHGSIAATLHHFCARTSGQKWILKLNSGTHVWRLALADQSADQTPGRGKEEEHPPSSSQPRPIVPAAAVIKSIVAVQGRCRLGPVKARHSDRLTDRRQQSILRLHIDKRQLMLAYSGAAVIVPAGPIGPRGWWTWGAGEAGWGWCCGGEGFILGRGGPAVDIQPRDRDLSDLAGRTANASELISGPLW